MTGRQEASSTAARRATATCWGTAARRGTAICRRTTARWKTGAWRSVGLAAAVAVVGLAGCDAVDPTRVVNPTTTDRDLARSPEPTKALLPGLKAQFARMINSYVIAAAVVSDDYSIHGTGIVVDLDEPRAVTPDLLNATGVSASGVYWNVQELRALADFVIEDIAPTDESATPALVAEARFYRGMANLTLGEVFSFAPHEEDGLPQPSSAALARAVADLEASSDVGLQSRAALARAFRLLGDAAAAEEEANAVLNGSEDFLFVQGYDPQFLPNASVLFLVSRSLQEMQPLPRLDFLDPKYTKWDSAIPVAKAEEMHLILAEIDLAAGALAAARRHLADAVELAASRGTATFNEVDERRNADRSLRPRSSEILVRADARSPYRGGLVLDRPAKGLEVPNISATSLVPDSVAALSEAAQLWHALWLARQEILFLEGRRLADLSIRLPMMRREIDQNSRISQGDPGTTAVVPSWIPNSPRYAMDIYTPFAVYDGTGHDAALLATELTMIVDMNRVLAENDVSPFRQQ